MMLVKKLNIYGLTSRNVSKLHEVFPDVDMVFGNGQKLSLTPENYLFRVGAYLFIYLSN
jgi:hypothetical protein